MNLFISNFKKEGRILATVLAALLAAELCLRIFGLRLSLDLQHIREIPTIVTALKNSPHPTLLFLGNSLTRRGVDETVFTKELEAHGVSDLHIFKIHPDDTDMADWLYLYKRYLLGAHAAPDLLLIGFAEKQLSDFQALHLDRLGAYFAGLGATSEAFHYDVLGFDARVSYLLASLSSAYANRERVRSDLFGLLIPHYKMSAQTLNNTVVSTHGAGDKHRMVPHYQRLTRLLHRVEAGPTKVILFAIPLPKIYPIDASLPTAVNENGAELIDLRAVQGIGENDFPDGYHLSPRGGEIFTRQLSHQLLASPKFQSVVKNGQRSSHRE